MKRPNTIILEQRHIDNKAFPDEFIKLALNTFSFKYDLGEGCFLYSDVTIKFLEENRAGEVDVNGETYISKILRSWEWNKNCIKLGDNTWINFDNKFFDQ